MPVLLVVVDHVIYPQVLFLTLPALLLKVLLDLMAVARISW